MKVKIIFIASLLVMLNCLTTKATDINNFSGVVTRYTKIIEIDAALSKAKSFEEIKVVVLKMYKIDTIPPFTEASFDSWNKLWCGDIAGKFKVNREESNYFEYVYEKRLWQMAGVRIGIDNEETTKQKIQLWWSKYKTKCKCDSVSFNVPNGNILKFAITKNATDFINNLVLNYDLDINFTDPADSKNLLDYISDEIQKMENGSASKSSIDIYKKYKEELISLGAKRGK